MMLDEIRHRLLGMPDPQVTYRPAVASAIAGSVRYLASDAALRSLDADVYWPKWDSPWWHMLLLHEMGEARRIPEPAVTRMVERLNAFPLKLFPIWPGELPSGADPHRDVLCHCALGSVYQVLAAAGRDVDRELPWIAPWFTRYQMADGGLSCDDSAYRVTGECPSSMVGTVAPFEAMLLGGPATWSAERAGFIARAAEFLIERRLMFGSQTVHNAEERTRDITWLAPCFPRFYFYDVLRGLTALARWAELTGRSVPLRAIDGVLEHLLATCADGVVWRKRVAYLGVGTWSPSPEGGWSRRDISPRFPLLEVTSGAGRPCPYLTRQWTDARFAVLRLIERGRVDPDA
jgi:hypothetical protein